jgi:hypothetical protein
MADISEKDAAGMFMISWRSAENMTKKFRFPELRH